jgi:hypothetical protein
MFEKASRAKLRFASPKGDLTAEDLWDLPLTSNTGKANLDDIARSLHRELKDSDEVSFVTPASGASETTQLAFDIVKHVIEVRIAERDAAALKTERAAKKQQILEIISKKETEGLMGASLDELREMANSL